MSSLVKLCVMVRPRWSVIDVPAAARWSLTLAFFAALNWMLLAPADDFQSIHIFLACQDKIAHLSIFLVLAVMARWSLPAVWAGGRMRLTALVVLLLYGGSIEAFQPFLAKAGRQFEVLDMVANFFGVFGGWRSGGLVMMPVAAQGIHSPGDPPVGPEAAVPTLAGTLENES